MKTPQAGILALGTASHEYLEFDATDAQRRKDLIAAISAIREPKTTVGGVNLVVGFRPELWREFAPNDTPADIKGFNQDIVGKDGYVMPATQHDAVLWLSGSAYDVVFDVAHAAITDLKPIASVAEETASWAYRHDRDLTEFIDGTQNPTLIEAPQVALIPEGKLGTAGSVLLLQKWKHETAAWEALGVHAQELAMGRTKLDSKELENKPANSHVAKTDQEEFGKIFRRNMPYGRVTHHGTMFVGFSAEQQRLQRMLESMAGVYDGTRCALTYYTKPLTGAYYFVPATESLAQGS